MVAIGLARDRGCCCRSASWCSRCCCSACAYVALPRLERNRGHRDPAADAANRRSRSKSAHSTPAGTAGIRASIFMACALLDRENGSASVTLPHVHLVVAWTSLVALDLRLKELAIDGPQLALQARSQRHTARRRLHDRPAGDCATIGVSSNWVMRQPTRSSFTTRNSRGAMSTQAARNSCLSQVELRLENRFGHHRFGLTGEPAVRACRAARSARRLHRNDFRRCARAYRPLLCAAGLRRHRGMARVAADVDPDTQRQGRGSSLARSSRRVNCAISSPTSCSPTSRRALRRTCRNLRCPGSKGESAGATTASNASSTRSN